MATTERNAQVKKDGKVVHLADRDTGKPKVVTINNMPLGTIKKRIIQTVIVLLTAGCVTGLVLADISGNLLTNLSWVVGGTSFAGLLTIFFTKTE